MKYRNVIIISDVEQAEDMQKYFFNLGYSYMSDYTRTKHRHVKECPDNCEGVYIIIRTDDLMSISFHNFHKYQNYMITDIGNFKVISFEKIIRKQKLEKLKQIK